MQNCKAQKLPDNGNVRPKVQYFGATPQPVLYSTMYLLKNLHFRKPEIVSIIFQIMILTI